MKRLPMRCRNVTETSADASRIARQSRRGSLFHQTMIYMTLASALMTVGGVCLHSILRADAADRKESRFLNSLIRVESQLRRDAAESADGGVRVESETRLTCRLADQNRCVWTVDRGIMTRTISAADGDSIVGTERYIFPAGSRVEFLQDSADSVSVQIVEPSVFVTSSAAAHEGSNLNKPAAESSPATPAFVAQPNRVVIRLKGATP